MSITLDAVAAALKGIVAPNLIAGFKETAGKVLITVQMRIPLAEKPAFAGRVKEKIKAIEGVKDVFVSFAEPPQQAGEGTGGAPTPQAAGAALKESIRHIVAVGAGKGGVGKSTVSVNMAVALAQKGHKVGLLDADIYGPSAAIMTGTIGHKARGDAQQRVIPADTHGISVISIAFLMPKDQAAVVWRGPMVGKMVQQLLMGVAWGELDYLIVDLPPGTGDAVLSLSQTVPLDGAVVVTTPQDVALLDVLKAIEMFKAVKVPVIGVVENMAGFACPKCGEITDIFMSGAGEKAAEQYGLPLLGKLPLDPAVPPGGDTGQPIVIAAPESATSKAFGDIADRVKARVDELSGNGPKQFQLEWSSGV